MKDEGVQEWVGKWAVEGEEKLCRNSKGTVFRGPATAAEMELYAEVVRLRCELRDLRDRALAWVPSDEGEHFFTSRDWLSMAQGLRHLLKTD